VIGHALVGLRPVRGMVVESTRGLRRQAAEGESGDRSPHFKEKLIHSVLHKHDARELVVR